MKTNIDEPCAGNLQARFFRGSCSNKTQTRGVKLQLLPNTKRKEYTAEFKIEAIRLVKETGQSSAKIARDLGISGDSLSRWVKTYNDRMSGVDAFPGKGKVAHCDKEKFDLKKELARVTRERDILKKALGYFANQKE